jgi:hypothetical protein
MTNFYEANKVGKLKTVKNKNIGTRKISALELGD